MKKAILTGLAALVLQGCQMETDVTSVEPLPIEPIEEVAKKKFPGEPLKRYTSQELMTMNFEDAAMALKKNHGYDLEGTDLINLSRLMYLEQGRDSAFWNEGAYDHEGLREAYGAMFIGGILNRHKLDIATVDGSIKCTDDSLFSKNKDLMSVVNGKNKRQYDAYGDNSLMFKNLEKQVSGNQVFTDAQIKKLTKREGGINDVNVRAQMALEVVYAALVNEIQDPTGGAVFYRANGWGKLNKKPAKIQAETSDELCEEWDVKLPHSYSQRRCRQRCEFYTDGAKEVKFGSHKYRPLRVEKTKTIYVDGKRK